MLLPLSMTSLEVNEKYKQEQKIQKTKELLEEKLNKRRKSEQVKYSALKEKRVAQINIQYDKKLEKSLSKLEKKYKFKTIDTRKKILNQKVKFRWPSDAKIKQKAFNMFQSYCRLKRANHNLRVILMDTGASKWYQGCDGWHFYPKHNYPHLAFEVDNCRPISKRMNKRQWDMIWYEWSERLIQEIGILRYNELEQIANDPFIKNIVRDRKYYQEKLDKYTLLKQQELERLGLTSDKKK